MTANGRPLLWGVGLIVGHVQDGEPVMSAGSRLKIHPDMEPTSDLMYFEYSHVTRLV